MIFVMRQYQEDFVRRKHCIVRTMPPDGIPQPQAWDLSAPERDAKTDESIKSGTQGLLGLTPSECRR